MRQALDLIERRWLARLAIVWVLAVAWSFATVHALDGMRLVDEGRMGGFRVDVSQR
jgi:hypothetical protein